MFTCQQPEVKKEMTNERLQKIPIISNCKLNNASHNFHCSNQNSFLKTRSLSCWSFCIKTKGGIKKMDGSPFIFGNGWSFTDFNINK